MLCVRRGDAGEREGKKRKVSQVIVLPDSHRFESNLSWGLVYASLRQQASPPPSVHVCIGSTHPSAKNAKREKMMKRELIGKRSPRAREAELVWEVGKRIVRLQPRSSASLETVQKAYALPGNFEFKSFDLARPRKKIAFACCNDGRSTCICV